MTAFCFDVRCLKVSTILFSNGLIALRVPRIGSAFELHAFSSYPLHIVQVSFGPLNPTFLWRKRGNRGKLIKLVKNDQGTPKRHRRTVRLLLEGVFSGPNNEISQSRLSNVVLFNMFPGFISKDHAEARAEDGSMPSIW